MVSGVKLDELLRMPSGPEHPQNAVVLAARGLVLELARARFMMSHLEACKDLGVGPWFAAQARPRRKAAA